MCAWVKAHVRELIKERPVGHSINNIILSKIPGESFEHDYVIL